MEGRTKKHKEAIISPERTKVWSEKSQKHHIRKVQVVYYLCRNRQLEHPHFMEVPLSSSDDLQLRDVIQRLNVLRGRGIASMYSWSCKRSYRNGYVWHDLSSDDIIHPAHGNEYILKASELFQESNLIEPPSSRNKQESSSPSSSPSGSDAGATKNFANASTQTEETDNENQVRTCCTRGVSTDDGSSEPNWYRVSRVRRNPEICSGEIDTLESLIRADIRKLKSFRMLQEDGFRIPSSAKIKVANVIMQLVSCGSISVKDNGFGLIPTYGSRFSNNMFRSPFILGEADRMAENPHPTGVGSKERSSCRNDEENVIKIEES